MKKKLKSVEAAKQFLVVWMRKNIQNKLIHKLGGYTKDEVITISTNNIHYHISKLKHHFISVEKEIYGKSKQEWIDRIHNEIKNI